MPNHSVRAIDVSSYASHLCCRYVKTSSPRVASDERIQAQKRARAVKTLQLGSQVTKRQQAAAVSPSLCERRVEERAGVLHERR